LQNKDGDLVPLASLGLTELEKETSQVFKPIGGEFYFVQARIAIAILRYLPYNL